jgi:hypothetical protein
MGSLPVVPGDQGTLGDQKILEKVDKLRELRIDIPLPQVSHSYFRTLVGYY